MMSSFPHTMGAPGGQTGAHPKIAIVVYLENAGFGSTSSAPLASLMIEKYLTGTISEPRQWWEGYIETGGFYKNKEH